MEWRIPKFISTVNVSSRVQQGSDHAEVSMPRRDM